MFLEVEVDKLFVDANTGDPVLVLREQQRGRYLPIYIGVSEARAIAGELEGINISEPQKHDHLQDLIKQLEGEFYRVVIDGFRDGLFLAVISLRIAGQSYEFDARPSEAVALALRCEVPVLVAPELFRHSFPIEFLPSSNETHPPKIQEQVAPLSSQERSVKFDENEDGSHFSIDEESWFELGAPEELQTPDANADKDVLLNYLKNLPNGEFGKFPH